MYNWPRKGCSGAASKENTMSENPLERAKALCETYSLQLPIMMAPMAGAWPTTLSIAFANAGAI